VEREKELGSTLVISSCKVFVLSAFSGPYESMFEGNYKHTAEDDQYKNEVVQTQQESYYEVCT
jgi:hypothetical protein